MRSSSTAARAREGAAVVVLDASAQQPAWLAVRQQGRRHRHSPHAENRAPSCTHPQAAMPSGQLDERAAVGHPADLAGVCVDTIACVGIEHATAGLVVLRVRLVQQVGFLARKHCGSREGGRWGVVHARARTCIAGPWDGPPTARQHRPAQPASAHPHDRVGRYRGFPASLPSARGCPVLCPLHT